MRKVVYKLIENQALGFPTLDVRLQDLLKILADMPCSETELFQAVEQLSDTDTAVDFFSSNPKRYVSAEGALFGKFEKMLMKRAREPSVIVSIGVLKELYRMEEMGIPINEEALCSEASQMSDICVKSISDMIDVAAQYHFTVTQNDIRGSTFWFPDECAELNVRLQAVRKDIKHANMLKPERVSKYIFQDQSGRSRLRTQWNIFGALSGRIQSYDFCSQGLPKAVRQKCIQPAHGFNLICADYVSEELILMAVLSNDTGILDSLIKQEDMHKKIAAEIFDISEIQVTKEERALAKAVDFAYLYGAGDETIRNIISEKWSGTEITVPKVKAAIRSVFTKVDKAVDEVKEKGYIELIDGTRISLDDIPKKHTYFNRMVQGSGAVILKKVVFEIAKQLPEGAYICFLLHDELMVEAPTYLTQVCVRIVTKAMTEVLRGYGYNIDLPITIEIKGGGEQDDV